MNCPACTSEETRTLTSLTAMGYKKHKCYSCLSQFNERTGTQFNFIEYRTEIVLLVVYHYYRFKLSLDDVVELMALRNIYLSHQTVHNWVHTFGVDLGVRLRDARRGNVGQKWHVDSTEIKVQGRKCYFYRCIDKEGNLVDVYLSDTKNQDAAEEFFTQCRDLSETDPEMITTDKEPALYPAISETFGERTKHRDVKYMNNRIEQDHRAVKSRYRAMKGCKDEFHALRFLGAFEEVRQLFNMKKKTRADRRELLPSKIQQYYDCWKTAS